MLYEVNRTADLFFLKSIRHTELLTFASLINFKGGKGVNQEHYRNKFSKELLCLFGRVD